MTTTKLPVTAELAERIAQRAVKICREDVSKRGWKSSGALQPYSNDGEVGIISSVKYLTYQNQGIQPFLMHWVEGRTLPLGCKQGDGPHFRVGREVGKPGWVDIPHKGKTWRSQKWRHPGLKPKRFMESAVTAAIKESQAEIQSEMMRALRGEG